jgi:hypothetical protein
MVEGSIEEFALRTAKHTGTCPLMWSATGTTAHSTTWCDMRRILENRVKLWLLSLWCWLIIFISSFIKSFHIFLSIQPETSSKSKHDTSLEWQETMRYFVFGAYEIISDDVHPTTQLRIIRNSLGLGENRRWISTSKERIDLIIWWPVSVTTFHILKFL